MAENVENNSFDLIVCGGGLSGVSAAIAAAREGAKVLLIERYGFLGGMATAGLVNPFMPYAVWKAQWQYNWDKKVNMGIFNEIIENLAAFDGLHQNCLTFNEELLKLILDRMINNYRVKVLFHSFIFSVKVNESRMLSLMVANKSGVSEYKAHFFVDATGDADISTMAGCAFKMGRDEDNLCQPMTLCFRLANIDRSKFNIVRDKQSINEKYMEFKRKGLISNPKEDVLIMEHMVEDVLHFNSTRVIFKSAVDAEDLTAAEIEAREQTYELFRFLKDNIPGFKNAQLLMTAPQIGIRESRRIVGEYTITQEDLLKTIKFEDSIARGTYPVDIHNPSGSGTSVQDIPYEDYYTIPYRALLPRGLDNLIVAGRPISSTHEAHASHRIMPICCNIGEGAGCAAAIALRKGIDFKEVNYNDIHDLLDKYGALY